MVLTERRHVLANWTGRVIDVTVGDAERVDAAQIPAWWCDLDIGPLVFTLRCPDATVDVPKLWQIITADVVRLDVGDHIIAGTLRSWVEPDGE